jgi:hypothetical protein
MQFAIFTRRTFLTVSFPGVLSLPIAAQTICLTSPRMSVPLQLTVTEDKADESCRSGPAKLTKPQMPPNQETCHGNR